MTIPTPAVPTAPDSETFRDICMDLFAERIHQLQKHGDQRGNGDYKWLAILTEEVGEAAQDILEGNYAGLVGELTQVAAVAIAHLEALRLRTEVQG